MRNLNFSGRHARYSTAGDAQYLGRSAWNLGNPVDGLAPAARLQIAADVRAAPTLSEIVRRPGDGKMVSSNFPPRQIGNPAGSIQVIPGHLTAIPF